MTGISHALNRHKIRKEERKPLLRKGMVITMMHYRMYYSFYEKFDEVLAANKEGEVKNLLITDESAEFLDAALYQLRCWVLDRGYNLVELDEKDDFWLPQIQSRELFEKLNQPNTVLLIRNYATVLWCGGENTPSNFLRDAVMNRHYGCGNDFVPSDELPNLLFVVALNDLSYMYWRKEEYSLFNVMHEKEYQKLWVNTRVFHPATQMHPVMSHVNKVVYQVSADGKNLSFKVSDAFYGLPRRPLHRNSFYDELIHLREEFIHHELEKNRLNFYEQVENLILKGDFARTGDEYKLDAARLLAVFPNLKCVCCHDSILIENAPPTLRVFDPFELGEQSFELAKVKDFKEATRHFRMLWALDSKWAKFWREVAKDFNRKPEDHPAYHHRDTIICDGMDDLFKIYLLGWYPKDLPIEGDYQKVYAEKHKNFQKAIDLLPWRFQNCDLHEVGEKLFWDLQFVEKDENPDYEGLANVILATEKIIPNVREGFFEAVQYNGCEESPSFLALKQLLEGSNTKD